MTISSPDFRQSAATKPWLFCGQQKTSLSFRGVRVLLDECVDWRLARELAGHHVLTARQMGWNSIINGELLTLAGREFDVFVTTVDRNLAFQQNITALPIAVIVLRARTDRLPNLKLLVPELRNAIGSVRLGKLRVVSTR